MHVYKPACSFALSVHSTHSSTASLVSGSDDTTPRQSSPPQALAAFLRYPHPRTPMKKSALSFCLALLIAIQSPAQEKFAVTSVVDAPTIAGRPVALDAQGELLPWPMPDNIGYSYSSHVLTNWRMAARPRIMRGPRCRIRRPIPGPGTTAAGVRTGRTTSNHTWWAKTD